MKCLDLMNNTLIKADNNNEYKIDIFNIYIFNKKDYKEEYIKVKNPIIEEIDFLVN